MGPTVTQLTQSRFYSPAFNAAVFDGPIRIYFAQHQEPLALQVYFRLQQHLKGKYEWYRQVFKQNGQTVFLMLYPTAESFESSFSKTSGDDRFLQERLGEDHVIGVCGPLMDDEYDGIFETVGAILESLPRVEVEKAL